MAKLGKCQGFLEIFTGISNEFANFLIYLGFSKRFGNLPVFPYVPLNFLVYFLESLGNSRKILNKKNTQKSWTILENSKNLPNSLEMFVKFRNLPKFSKKM